MECSGCGYGHEKLIPINIGFNLCCSCFIDYMIGANRDVVSDFLAMNFEEFTDFLNNVY